MLIFIFVCIVLLFQGVFSKSIQNITQYENKIDALERSMELLETRLNNFTGIMHNVTNRKLIKCKCNRSS